jgi:predicted membrane-bound mannosyltransferase
MTIIYSIIPYKTPWCLLSFLHGMILLAGIGVVAIVTRVREPAPRRVILALLVVAVTHLAVQAYRGSFVYYSDSRNPYVYAHPTNEVLAAVRNVEAVARFSGQGNDMLIQVACTANDYWPLPWYFRAFKHVGWYSVVPDKVGSLILISPDLESSLADALYTRTPPADRRMYVYLFDDPYSIRFRPGVKLMGFVRKDLWDRYRQRDVKSDL